MHCAAYDIGQMITKWSGESNSCQPCYLYLCDVTLWQLSHLNVTHSTTAPAVSLSPFQTKAELILNKILKSLNFLVYIFMAIIFL